MFFLSLYTYDIANGVESRAELEAIANKLQASLKEVGLEMRDKRGGLPKLSLCSSLRTGFQRRMGIHLT